MAVYTIYATVTAQDITLSLGDVKVVSGSKDLYQLSLSFSDEWASYTKKVVFETPEPKRSVIEILLDGTNICTIPTRSLSNPTALRIGVYGVGTNYEEFPTVWSERIPIYEGTYKGFDNPAAPDPEVYDEILAAMAGKQDILTWDSSAKLDSDNPVTSKGIYIDEKNINKAVGAITSNEPLMFTKGIFYSTPTNDSAVSETPSANVQRSAVIVPCLPGDVFSIRARGGTGAFRGYAFLRSDRTIIQKAASSTDIITRVLYAPPEAAYFLAQTYSEDSTSYAYSEYYAFRNRPAQELQTILKDAGFEVLDWASGRFPTGNVGETVDWSARGASTSAISAIGEVSEGDRVYFATTNGSATYRSYAFADANYKVLEKASANNISGVFNRIAPEGAKYVVANSDFVRSIVYCAIQRKKTDIPQDAFGNVGMFNSIAVIGTSWDAGYFYSSRSGEQHAYERRNKAWIKILGNMYGIPAYNFGVTSGTTCLPDSPLIGEHGAVSWQGDSNGLSALQASDMTRTLVFMDLVQNDANKFGSEYLGTIADIKSDYTLNPDTFYGNYARIIELVTKSFRDRNDYVLFVFCYKKGDQVSEIENTYAVAVVPTLNWFDDLWFEKWVYPHLVQNHPVMSDYANFAKVIDRLFSNVMRHNWDYFKDYIPKAE